CHSMPGSRLNHNLIQDKFCKRFPVIECAHSNQPSPLGSQEKLVHMKLKTLFGSTALAAILTGCDSGGVTLAPTNNVTNSNNTTGGETGGSTNPCASYARSGQTIQGSFDGTHCTYSNTFVSDNNPLSVDLTIPALANNGL